MEIDYIEAQYAELLAEVQRLEEQRAVLYLHDPNTVSEMLENLGIKCPSPLDVELAKLPQALVGMVERIGLQDVELQIPLTNFRALQQIAMGLGSSHSLILRLTFDDSMKLLGFCLHLEELSTENNLNTHHPWDVSEGNLPNGPFCHSSGNRTIYHLARILTRYLRGGFKSLENIYEVATSALKELTHSCLVCGAFHRAKLRRSAICDLQECSRLFLRASLEIRVAEILHDAQVVDLLLTSIFHAASTRNMLLLPGCPFPNTLTIYQLLSKMPPISTLTQAPDLIPAIKNLGSETEKLLSWACLSYRGFLASATGIMRIPGMPAGTQQFLLASAAPLLETGFAEESNIPGGKIRVVWHGTHLTRLFAILSQGLQIKSGTALQTHGAVHGNGIYVAEEPATSWAYCDKISPVGWPGSELNGCAVLLGVELVCFNEKSGVKVWLVDSPTAVIVRYVFLVPVEAARMPRKADVLPAMVSALHALRVGSV